MNIVGQNHPISEGPDGKKDRIKVSLFSLTFSGVGIPIFSCLWTSELLILEFLTSEICTICPFVLRPLDLNWTYYQLFWFSSF